METEVKRVRIVYLALDEENNPDIKLGGSFTLGELTQLNLFFTKRLEDLRAKLQENQGGT